MAEHLFYEVIGDESKPPMLMIHGFLTSNFQWELNWEALSRHYRLIMVETWGHGRSPTPTDPEAYTADNYIRELERIRATLSVDKWMMVGQSFGAGVVISYALRHREHVIGVAFTNSRLAIGAFSREERRIPKEKFENIRSLPMHPINARRLDEKIKARFVEIADSVCPTAGHLGSEKSYTMACRGKFHQLQVPVLLCNGIYEKIFQPDVEFAQKALPSLKVVALDAGHSTNVDDPAGFNKAVIDFFDSICH